jgi:hypothetical protein
MFKSNNLMANSYEAENKKLKEIIHSLESVIDKNYTTGAHGNSNMKAFSDTSATNDEQSRKVISSFVDMMNEDQIKEFTYILMKNLEAKAINQIKISSVNIKS